MDLIHVHVFEGTIEHYVVVEQDLSAYCNNFWPVIDKDAFRHFTYIELRHVKGNINWLVNWSLLIGSFEFFRLGKA